MRWIALIAIACLGLCAQDAGEIVRKPVELDQANWLRMRDYTWIAHTSLTVFDFAAFA